MDKKTIALIVILAVFLLFYFQIMEFLGLYHPTLPKEVNQKQTVVDTTTSTKVKTTATPAINKDTLTTTTKTLKSIVNAPVDSIKSDTVIVKTNRYRILLTSYGGGPISIILKDYNYRDGKPIEMLPHASFVTPEATFAAGAFSTSRVKFVSSLPPGEYDATNKELDLVYTYQSSAGGEIIKRFHFYPNKYNYDLSFSVDNIQQLGFERQYNLVWNTPLGVTEPQPELDYRSMEAVAMQSGSREKLDDFNKGKLNQSLDGNTAWAGLRSKYFAAVMIPKNREAASVFANGEKTKIPAADNKTIEKRTITVGLSMPFASVSHFTDSFTVFVGPLDYTLMSKYKVGLEDILGIGTTPYVGWIIKPFAIAIIWLLP
ncbi:MAG: membrane protein insertase YidC, partial [FCB group bacterium]|nr:membrane protein insertase YidC [FCB group bacterium]